MKKIPVTVRLTPLLKQNAETLAELHGKTLNEYIIQGQTTTKLTFRFS